MDRRFGLLAALATSGLVCLTLACSGNSRDTASAALLTTPEATATAPPTATATLPPPPTETPEPVVLQPDTPTPVPPPPPTSTPRPPSTPTPVPPPPPPTATLPPPPAPIPDGPLEVTLQLKDLSFDPHAIHGNHGQQVIVTLAGSQNEEHTFTIPTLGVDVKIAAKGSATARFVVPSEGISTFYCKVHGTPNSGMHGQLVFH